jgi:hypothetical protein
MLFVHDVAEQKNHRESRDAAAMQDGSIWTVLIIQTHEKAFGAVTKYICVGHESFGAVTKYICVGHEGRFAQADLRIFA